MIKRELIEKLSQITEEEQKLLGGDPIDRDIYMKQSENIVSSKKLLDSGKLITLRPHTRFIDFPPHSHDYIELVYMCSGHTFHTVNGTRIELKEGELLFLSQNAVQSIEAANENDIAVNFIILPSFFDKCLDMMGEEETPLRRFLIDAISGNISNTAYLHFHATDILPIQNLLENMIWTLINGNYVKNLINQMTMGLLFIHLIKYSYALEIEGSDKTIALRTLHYIEGNYKDGTLKDVSDIVGVDVFRLSREIKKHTNMTFTELIQERRMSQAAYLLCHTAMKVSDIANAVGYYNMTYFHHVFTEKYGCSPKKYRDDRKNHL